MLYQPHVSNVFPSYLSFPLFLTLLLHFFKPTLALNFISFYFLKNFFLPLFPTLTIFLFQPSSPYFFYYINLLLLPFTPSIYLSLSLSLVSFKGWYNLVLCFFIFHYRYSLSPSYGLGLISVWFLKLSYWKWEFEFILKQNLLS